MEDALCVNSRLRQGEALFGVFDGHGGREVAQFCSCEVVSVLENLESYANREYATALRECFIELDALLNKEEGLAKIVTISKQVQEEQR